MLVCLQPLSQYKKKELYRHVETFDLADPSLFEDASISNNLCITICRNKFVDKYSWKDLLLESVDQRYYEFYKWNMDHNKGLVAIQQIYKKPEDYCQDTDFIDTSRCVGREHGYGYKWNVTKTDLNNGRIAFAFSIHFNTKLAKDNFAKWWYNGKKGEQLASKVVMGAPISSITRIASFVIPQIDWENISDSLLWKAGNYDNAVLAEMGLKWKDGVIVKC